MVEAAFVTHFPIPPIYPYLPFTPGYLIGKIITAIHMHIYGIGATLVIVITFKSSKKTLWIFPMYYSDYTIH